MSALDIWDHAYTGDDNTADLRRLEFLVRLGRENVHVTNWEAGMIKTANQKEHYELKPKFTPGQRVSIDKMFKQYPAYAPIREGEAKRAALGADLADPVQGQCGYLVKKEGEHRQTRCGGEAALTIQLPGGPLDLCAEHVREREELLAKLRKQKERLR